MSKSARQTQSNLECRPLEDRLAPALFGPELNYTVGFSPTVVEVGDFNNDGRDDLVVANGSTSAYRLSILLGTGQGGLIPAPTPTFPVGELPLGIAIGDFNGDGRQDLATANTLSSNVTILLGRGDGSFSTASIAVGAGPDSVAVGDFNEDGDQDLAVANRNSDNVSILLGNGAGGFTPAAGSPIPGGDVPGSIAVGDFDNNGHQDLAVANLGSDDVSIFLGNGTGSFAPASGSPIPVPDLPIFLILGDFNGDRNEDLALVSTSTSDNMTVLLGNGSGGFAATPQSPLPLGDGPQMLTVGDLNGDGRQDLVTTSFLVDEVGVFLGSGDGSFAHAPGSPFIAGNAPVHAAIGDFNGDGTNDIALANNANSGITLLLNQGGTTTTLTSSAPEGVYGQAITLTAAVDAAFGGVPDGTVVFREGSAVLGTVPLVNGTAMLTFPTSAPLPAGSHLFTADYGGSGNFVSSNSAAFVQNIALGPTTTTVIAAPNPAVAGEAVAFTVLVDAATGAAVDDGTVTLRDGSTILATAPVTDGVASVTRTLDTGTHSITAVYTASANLLGSTSTVLNVSVTPLSPPPPPPPPPPPVEPDLPSFAAGGALDGSALRFTRTGDQLNTVPAGVIAPFGSIAANLRPATADVNGDDIADTIVVTGPGTPIRFAVVSGADGSTLLVPPTAPFAGSEDFTGGGFVSAADFDRDGRAEIIVTPDLGGGPRVTIFSLNLDGSLAVRANFFGIDDPNFLGGARTGAGDVNNDGTPDLAVAAGFEGGPLVALFDGTTLFATPTRLLNDFFAFEESLRNGAYVAIGDVDGDRFGDLVFGAGPGGAPRVLIVSGQRLLSGGAVSAIANPLANFFVAGNVADRGGVRVATTDADGDDLADLAVCSGEGSPARVRVYLGKDLAGGGEPTASQDLDVFGGAVLANGVFVG